MTRAESQRRRGWPGATRVDLACLSRRTVIVMYLKRLRYTFSWRHFAAKKALVRWHAIIWQTRSGIDSVIVARHEVTLTRERSSCSKSDLRQVTQPSYDCKQ